MSSLADNINRLRRKAERESSSVQDLLIAAGRAADSIIHGHTDLGKPGTGEKFWQFRNYDRSDRPQDIDWRQSAKGDAVFVREKERQTQQTILFDCAGGPGMAFHSARGLPSKAETARVLCLASAMLAARAGEKIGGLSGGMQAGRSERAIESLAAALLNKNDAINAMEPQNAYPLFFAVLAGDFLEPVAQAETLLSSLRPRISGGLLIQVLDPAELDFPFHGRSIFTDSDGAHPELIADPRSIRETYIARIKDHNSALHSACGKAGFTYILHRTDTPVRVTLATISRLLSGRGGTVPS